MSKATTPEFRVAFPTVFRPKLNTQNEKMEYSIVALFPKGTDLSKLAAAAGVALEKKFGADKSKWPGDLSKYKSPFRDQGDREKKDPETGKMVLPQGYEKGAMYMNLRSGQKPGVVDKAVQPIIDESEFYGGCYCIATINAYAYDIKGNRGVSFGLGNVQKVRDGDPFGNRSKPEEDFAPVAGAETGNQVTAAGLF